MATSDLDFSSVDSFFELVDRWFGPIGPDWGHPLDELDLWPLPEPLRRWLATIGKAPPPPGADPRAGEDGEFVRLWAENLPVAFASPD